MLKPHQHDPNAPWQQRFGVPPILWTQQAKAAPTRGLLAGTHSGRNQLYAWDITTGELSQLTDQSTGVLFGALAPDGRWVYYLQDEGGSDPAISITACWRWTPSPANGLLNYGMGQEAAYKPWPLSPGQVTYACWPRRIAAGCAIL